MFNETVCLENLKHIVSESADDQHIKNLSLDELRPTYTEITDNIYRISVFNCHTYKNMLWNFDNLKPEIRSNFQTELFSTWHSVYLKSMKTDRPAGHPEDKEQESTIPGGEEERPEVKAQGHTPGTAARPPIEGEKEKPVSPVKDADPGRDPVPAKKQSLIPAPKTSAPVYKEDWFDRLLNFFAVITGYVSGIF